MAAVAYSDISALVPQIWEATLMYAQADLIMPPIVDMLTDRTGFAARFEAEYSSSGTVFNSASESFDLTSQAFTPAALGTITIKEVGYRFDITDRRAATDPVDVGADAAQEFNYKIMSQVDIDLMAQFSAFTGATIWAGTVASTAGTLTWGNVYAGVSMMRKNKVKGPYFVVVDPLHYHGLATALNIASTNAAPLQFRNDVQSEYLVQQVGRDIFLYSSPLLATASNQVYMGIFNRQALKLDIRRGLVIEPQRDASFRLTELNASMWYGVAAMRPSWGVQIRGTVIASVNN